MSDAEVPQPKPEGGEQLNIKVKDADGNEVFFKVKRTTKLSKLKKAYAERMGKPENSVRFIFDGQRIGDNDTAETGKYSSPHDPQDAHGSVACSRCSASIAAVRSQLLLAFRTEIHH